MHSHSFSLVSTFFYAALMLYSLKMLRACTSVAAAVVFVPFTVVAFPVFVAVNLVIAGDAGFFPPRLCHRCLMLSLLLFVYFVVVCCVRCCCFLPLLLLPNICQSSMSQILGSVSF